MNIKKRRIITYSTMAVSLLVIAVSSIALAVIKNDTGMKFTDEPVMITPTPDSESNTTVEPSGDDNNNDNTITHTDNNGNIPEPGTIPDEPLDDEETIPSIKPSVPSDRDSLGENDQSYPADDYLNSGPLILEPEEKIYYELG